MAVTSAEMPSWPNLRRVRLRNPVHVVGRGCCFLGPCSGGSLSGCESATFPLDLSLLNCQMKDLYYLHMRCHVSLYGLFLKSDLSEAHPSSFLASSGRERSART